LASSIFGRYVVTRARGLSICQPLVTSDIEGEVKRDVKEERRKTQVYKYISRNPRVEGAEGQQRAI
jgi:hypothetical protein